MTKQAKQRIHRNYMQTKMHKVFNEIGAAYFDFGIIPNRGYYFKFDKLTDLQKEAITKAHPKPELISWCISQLEYAPEIKKAVLFLTY